MAKKRALSPPPPVESSDEEAGSESLSSGEEEEIEETAKKPSANPDSKEDGEESGEEEEDGEEEEEDGEEEEESAEEEEDKNTTTKSPATVTQPAEDSGSESEESGSEADAAMAVKPISSKPMPAAAAAAESSEKATLFQRIWSHDDEIALINGILDYKNKTGIVPHPTNKKTGDFPSIVKKSLNMDATDGQINDKLRRLKGKYEKASKRNSPLPNPHDRMMLEISTKIWGNGSSKATVANGKNGKEMHVGNNGYLFLKEALAAKGYDFAAIGVLEKLDPAKARALDDKFKKHKMAVMKHHIQKMELQKETFKLMMDGIDKSG